jgi:hypothetical protein
MIGPARVAPVPINLCAHGTIPGAILCNPGGQAANGDTLPDLMRHFYMRKTGFTDDDTTGFLQT